MTGLAAEKVSKISLVDLAGSERAKDTGAEGRRLQVHLTISGCGYVLTSWYPGSCKYQQVPDYVGKSDPCSSGAGRLQFQEENICPIQRLCPHLDPQGEPR